ncbi:MAG: VWA domain-containing protein [Deltaproteobacteria bacterium]|nr:VWA domain-containing protein [Deltaproteobacteria bacterium]MBN2670277.1 VWA domain-containing protein [Deltaproteobacteria bacterium]
MKNNYYEIKLALFLVFFFASMYAYGSDDVSPGLHIDAGGEAIPLPLKSTTVRGNIKGFVADIKVVQEFVNPYDKHIQATYVFPLSASAAVYHMEMKFKSTVVKAVIKKKEEAQQIYDEAVQAGKTAALLEQNRPNIFTQKVGNIPPGEKVTVTLTYLELLPYEQGVSSFVFPTVVGPRYIPQGAPTGLPDKNPQGRVADNARVPDASAITPPSFAEGETGAHRIDLRITVYPKVAIQTLTSPSHQISVSRQSKEKAVVTIKKTDTVPNKDFVLKIDVRDNAPAVAVLTHKEKEDDGYVTLAIQPPAHVAPKDATPKDLFFVVDNSGSMSGAPLNACKDLIKEALTHLNPGDRFTVMRFSDSVSTLSSAPLANTKANVQRAVQYVNDMHGMGGTEMLSGIRRALEGKPENGRVRIVFFLTDGYIGNDNEILAAVKDENHANARLFSLGVGSSVNRYLLSGMARLGRGKVQFVRYDEDPKPVVENFYRMVRNPVLTDISLKWNGVSATNQVPQVIPDLFDGEPLVVHSRYTEGGDGELEISGFLGNKYWRKKIAVHLPNTNQNPDIAKLWARAKISMWSDIETGRPGAHREDIETLAIEHNLMSQYTSFVAVAETISRQEGEPLIPVTQRIPLPDSVSQHALGTLSRYEIPPGDPFIAVKAPSDVKKVTAVFPFGLVKDLRYDASRDRWRGRFLVPTGIPDGHYAIVIAITHKDGTVELNTEMFHLDSEAAEFITNFDNKKIQSGKGLLLKVDTIEPAAEVYIHCEALGLNRVQFLQETDDGIRWEKWISFDKTIAPGAYSALVVMRDTAGNRIEQTVTIHIVGAKK